MTLTVPDPTLLCREAEAWAARLADVAMWQRRGVFTQVSPAEADTLASLLSQLAAVARAAGART